MTKLYSALFLNFQFGYRPNYVFRTFEIFCDLIQLLCNISDKQRHFTKEQRIEAEASE